MLIQGGTVQLRQKDGYSYERRDIRVEDGRIARLAADIPPAAGEEVLDAADMLIIPGLVNSHLHSHDNLNRGFLDNLPLELWMACIRPFYSGEAPTAEEVYLRTLLGAVEMLRGGVTTVLDDVILAGPTDGEGLSQVVRAYRDIGMRAVVCPHTKNIPMEKTIPYAEEQFTAEMRAATNRPTPPEETILRFLEEQLVRYNRPGERVTVGLSASAPQRCTLPLWQGMAALAGRHGVPLVSHILETYVQKRTGELFYGKSLVRYLADHGLLHPNLVAVHCNWADDEDIRLLGQAGCAAVHNPCCNMKMGSGIAPVRRLLDRCPVGLGTDNISANDTASLFEAMKAGALLSKLPTPDYSRWLAADDLLAMATRHGARCALLQNQIGAVAVGMRADLVLLDTRNERLALVDDYSKALVYGENGRSVDTVLVDGAVVVRRGRLTMLEEERFFAALRPLGERVRAGHRRSLAESRDAVSVFAECYRRCNAERTEEGGPLP